MPNKEYYWKNREKVIKANKEFYLKNKEHINKRNKNYWKNRPVEMVEKHRAKNKIYMANLRLKAKQIKLDYKKDKSCVKCGYNEHTEILQFHHTKNNKELALGDTKGYNIKQFLAEIKKCVLMCPNCHQWLHHKERNPLII